MHTMHFNLQHAKENGRVHGQRPQQVKLEEDEVMTEAIVVDSLRRALDQFSSVQARDGHWPAGYSGVMFILPGMVHNCYLQLISLIYLLQEIKCRHHVATLLACCLSNDRIDQASMHVLTDIWIVCHWITRCCYIRGTSPRDTPLHLQPSGMEKFIQPRPP